MSNTERETGTERQRETERLRTIVCEANSLLDKFNPAVSNEDKSGQDTVDSESE